MKIHIVKKGDTLFELSKKYNVPLEKLIEANPQIANPNQLNVGDKVKIPAVAVPIGGEPGNIYKHVVKQGDTLWKLSKAWGLPLQNLIAANPQLNDPNQLKVGDIVNIPTGSGAPAGGADNPSGANTGMLPAQTGKKNTAPIAGAGTKVPTGVKPEMTAPKPPKVEAPKVEVPKIEPVQKEKPKEEPMKVEPVKVEPPKQQPVHVEPPKAVPMEIKIEVEQIQYESTKLQPIHYEPQKHEPVKVEPYHYEPMNIAPANYGPPNVSPAANVPMKGEPTGVSPYGYESMKGEPTGVSPYSYGPNVQPNVYANASYPNSNMLPFYPTQQSPMILPAMGYAPSPCGCSGTSPYPYAAPEAYPPFYQYPIAAEPVSANYGSPSTPTALSPMEGEYPGISNVHAPASQMPDLGGMSPYTNQAPNSGYQPYGISPEAVSPKSYGNTFHTQAMDWGHQPGYMPCYGPPVPGYSTSVMPAAYSAPSMPGYPMAYPEANNQAPISYEPLKGEVGGIENMKGHFDREAQVSDSSDELEDSGQKKTETKSKTQTSSKKSAKISGSLDSQSASKKQSKSSAGTASKKTRQRTSKASGRRNPWINE